MGGPAARPARGWLTDGGGGSVPPEGPDEVDNRSIERCRLIQVCGVTSVGQNDFAGAGNLCCHVIGRCQKGCIVCANQNQRGYSDSGQRLDHMIADLGEHPARSMRETGCRTMFAQPDFCAATERFETVSFERRRLCICGPVPGCPSLAGLIPGAGIEQHQSPASITIHRVKREAHVAAERESANDGLLHIAGVQDGSHVVHRQAFRVLFGIVWTI